MQHFVRRFLYSVLIGAFLALLLGAGTLLYVFSFYTSVSTQQRDCAVVFGAAVWPGGEPSHALSDRTRTAISLYHNHQVSCLIFSGADSVYGFHEVDVMLELAYEAGVALEDIELDYAGINTKDTISHLDVSRSYILVSNDFHLARIYLLVRLQKISDFDVHRSVYELGRYTKEPFFIVREVGAIWYYALGGERWSDA